MYRNTNGRVSVRTKTIIPIILRTSDPIAIECMLNLNPRNPAPNWVAAMKTDITLKANEAVIVGIPRPTR